MRTKKSCTGILMNVVSVWWRSEMSRFGKMRSVILYGALWGLCPALYARGMNHSGVSSKGRAFQGSRSCRARSPLSQTRTPSQLTLDTLPPPPPKAVFHHSSSLSLQYLSNLSTGDNEVELVRNASQVLIVRGSSLSCEPCQGIYATSLLTGWAGCETRVNLDFYLSISMP